MIINVAAENCMLFFFFSKGSTSTNTEYTKGVSVESGKKIKSNGKYLPKIWNYETSVRNRKYHYDNNKETVERFSNSKTVGAESGFVVTEAPLFL